MSMIVWAGIRAGLAPLGACAPVEGRAPNDLAPLELRESAPREVHALAKAINTLLAEVRERQCQRRFISDAAHQLRTPLAGLKSQTELALASETAGPRCARGCSACTSATRSAPRQPAADAGARRAGSAAGAQPRRPDAAGRSSPPSGCRAPASASTSASRRRPRRRGGAGQRAAAARDHRQPDRQRDPATPAAAIGDGAGALARARRASRWRTTARHRAGRPRARVRALRRAPRCGATAAAWARDRRGSPSATAAGWRWKAAAPRTCACCCAAAAGMRSAVGAPEQGKSGVNVPLP